MTCSHILNVVPDVQQIYVLIIMTEQNGTVPVGALVAVGEARSALNREGLDTHTQAIGVIAPPPDIRAIADKTAQFVARNGAFIRVMKDKFYFKNT